MERLNLNAQSIGEILKKKAAPDILRLIYMPYKMDISLQVFKRLGENLFGKYDIDPNNEFVIKNIVRWAHGDGEMQSMNPETRKIESGVLTKGIYIAGPTGTGKSAILDILSRYLGIDDVRVLIFGKNNKMLSFPCYTANRICAFYKENGELYPFTESSVICFQDLGTEQRETLFMGTRTKVMQTILQERGDGRGLITLISSNNGICDNDTLELYGDRIVSRLKKMCNYFELKGNDRRK